MGTVTASTGDTYSTVTSWEAIVGVDDGLGGAVATGTATLSGTFAEDSIVFNVGNNTSGMGLTEYPFVLTGGTIQADASGGANFVCEIADDFKWRDFAVAANGAVDGGTAVFRGLVLQPNGASGGNPAESIKLVRGTIGPIGFEHFGGAELRGITCEALPEDSSVQILNCHVYSMCGFDSGDTSVGIDISSSHPNDGRALVYNNTVNTIRSSGDCTNYGISFHASGTSNYNVVELVGGNSDAACYSPNIIVNDRPAFGGQNNQGASSDKTAMYNPDINPFGGSNPWSNPIGDDGSAGFGRGGTIPRYKIPGYISGAEADLRTAVQAEALKGFDQDVSINGFYGHAGAGATYGGGHYGAYTYKASIGTGAATNAYLSSIEGTQLMVPEYLRITSASDAEVDFFRPDKLGVGNKVVIYQGANINAEYDSVDDALIDCGHNRGTPTEHNDTPDIWIEECKFNMHDKKWDAVISNATQVGRCFLWSSGNVNNAIYNTLRTNRNAIISKIHTNGDYGFNGGIYAQGGSTGGYYQSYNTIVNCGSGLFQNGYLYEGINNLILNTDGGDHVHEQGMIDESLDDVSNMFRARYGNYAASGVFLTDYLRNPDFTEFDTVDDWRTVSHSPSVNKGGDAANYHPSEYHVASGNVIAAYNHPYIDLSMTLDTSELDGRYNNLTQPYDWYDINHADMAVPVLNYPSWYLPSGAYQSKEVTPVSERPYGYAVLEDAGANRLRFSVTGGVPDPGINEHSEGESLAAPLLPFIDF